MRTFESGATRDSEEGKYAYAGFLAPIVLERFGEYMHRHRQQADGSLRASDNWKKLFGPDHKSVCLDSLLRHDMDLWLIHEGFPRLARESLENAPAKASAFTG